MKRLSTLSFLICLVFGLHAQCINEMTETEPGLYPENLPDACVGTMYEQTVQFVVPNDTTVPPFPQIQIDSAEIKSITGMPDGLSYSCHNEQCRVINSGGDVSHGCFKVEGTPTEALSPSNTVTITITLYGEGGFSGDVEYDVEFDSYNSGEGTCNAVGIADYSQFQHGFAAYPNPSNQDVVYFSEEATHVMITNASGEVVFQRERATEFNTSHLTPGIYTITAKEGATRLVIH